MPYVGQPSDTQAIDIGRIAEKMMLLAVGEDPTAAAMAALQVTMVLWALGGATQEQAKKVCVKAIEATISKREN